MDSANAILYIIFLVLFNFEYRFWIHFDVAS